MDTLSMDTLSMDNASANRRRNFVRPVLVLFRILSLDEDSRHGFGAGVAQQHAAVAAERVRGPVPRGRDLLEFLERARATR